MKIGVISDIHIDEQKDETAFERIFSDCINESGADVFLIAGDISEYYIRSLNFIKRLRGKISCKLFFCPGNHDLWSKYEPEKTVDDIIAYMNSEDGDEGFIQNKAVPLSKDTVLIAGCGWYDYTFSYSDRFSKKQMKEKKYMDRQWKDGLYARHERPDEDVNRDWNAELHNLIDLYSDCNVIFMTHMVNHPAFLVGSDHEKYEMFQYFNGFMGSQGLYEITKRINVKYSISGHVHYRKSFYDDNGTYYMCRCLGYPGEFSAFGGKQDLKAQINNTIEIIVI